MTRPRSSTLLAQLAQLVVLSMIHAGAQASPCTSDEYITQVAAVSDLQTSATLLAGVIDIMGGAPDNSTVFLPTDAAWAAFKTQNGDSAPDANRSVAIFLYNSVIGLGEASTVALAAASPIQTSAYALQLAFSPSDVNITVVVKAAASSNGTTGTITSMSDVTGTLATRYDFCETYTYTVDKVLLPAADYASTPTTYISEIMAVNARIEAIGSSATLRSPPPPSAMAPTGATPAAVTPASTSAATSAVGSALSLACGLAGAGMLLLA